MGSTLHHLSIAVLLLTAGCSSSGLFGGRATNGRNSVAEGFPAKEEASEAPNRQTAKAPRRPKQSPESTAAIDPELRRRKVAEHLANASRAEEAGDSRGARAAYERLLQIEPSHSFAHYQLAVIADNEARFDDAERHYQVLLRKTPENPDLLASLGWSYLLQRRYDESEQLFRKALQIDPRHRTALYNLGWLYGTQGDYDNALATFRAAGSETDAQQAITELFPQGRPAASSQNSALAPRNPFRPPTRDKPAGDRPSAPGVNDQSFAANVSAPIPWKTQEGSGGTGSGPTAPNRTEADQRAGARNEGPFDEAFSSLEEKPAARAGRSSIPQDIPPFSGPALAHDRERNPPQIGTVRTAGFDQASPFPAGNSPVITPRRGAQLQTPPADLASEIHSGRSSAAPPTPFASQRDESRDRSLPDWPFHAESIQNTPAKTRTDALARNEAQTTAALIGLCAGPGNYLFPLVTPTWPASASR